MFWLGFEKVAGSINSKQQRDSRLIHALQQGHMPPERRRGNSGRPDSMADIVVAVTKGPFTIFPGFPPMHRRETDKKGADRKWLQQPRKLIGRELRPPLQTMFPRRIVIQTRHKVQPFDSRRHDVPFRRMQIAGRGVAPQRPLRLTRFFPGGQGQGELKEPRQGPHRHRPNRNRPVLIEGGIGRRYRFFIRGQQGERNQVCTHEPAKGIRLVCPIEKSEGPGIPVILVFGPHMVLYDPIDRISRWRFTHLFRSRRRRLIISVQRYHGGSLPIREKESKRGRFFTNPPLTSFAQSLYRSTCQRETRRE